MIDILLGALGALKATIDVTKGAIDAHDTVKLTSLKLELTERMLAVSEASMHLQQVNATLQQENHTLAQEKRDLESEIVKLSQKQDRMAQYQSAQLPTGAPVYIKKGTETSPHGPEYACATCMERGDITPLQFDHNGVNLRCGANHPDVPYRRYGISPQALERAGRRAITD